MPALEGRAVPLHAGAAVGLDLAGPGRGGVLHLDLMRGEHIDDVGPLARDDVGGGGNGRRRHFEAGLERQGNVPWLMGVLDHMAPETSLSWRV